MKDSLANYLREIEIKNGMIKCFKPMKKLFSSMPVPLIVFATILAGGILISAFDSFSFSNLVLLLGIPTSVATVYTQRQSLELAKAQADITTLLPHRLEIIKEFSKVFDDITEYDEDFEVIPIIEPLLLKYGCQIELLFGARAFVLLDGMKHSENCMINLSKKEQTEQTRKQYDKYSERYYNNGELLYDLFYRSIRVSENI